MAILTTMEIHGDVDELITQHREIIDPIAQPLAEENGNTSHLPELAHVRGASPPRRG
jgi:hypothetical protein